MDTVSVETRSKVMAQVRSQRNRSTEWRLRSALARSGIRGWVLNPTTLAGKPDFAFSAERLAIFVDGCFWHGCPVCKRIPSSNSEYWNRKITRNRARDAAVNLDLTEAGWRVLRIWEHELDDIDSVLQWIKESSVITAAAASR